MIVAVSEKIPLLLNQPLAKIVEAVPIATLSPHRVITLPNLITNYLRWSQEIAALLERQSAT